MVPDVGVGTKKFLRSLLDLVGLGGKPTMAS